MTARRIVAGVIALVAVGVLALNVLRDENGPTTGAGPSASATSDASASIAPSASGAATQSPEATAQSSTSPPADFTQVATFPKTTATALSAWPAGWAAIGQAEAGAVVWQSADGVAWDEIVPTGLEDGVINHLVAIPDGRLLALGFRDDGSLGGVAEAWISSDGRDWQKTDLGIQGLLNAVDIAAGPLGLVIIGRAETNAAGRNEYAWHSEDGLDWARVWEAVDDEILAAVGAGPEGFVMVGQQRYEHGGNPIGVALASADGREWIEAPTDGPVGLAGMWSVVPTGGDWVATSLGGADINVLLSPNGLDWTADTAFPGADARQGGIAQLAGDADFAGRVSVIGALGPDWLAAGSEFDSIDEDGRTLARTWTSANALAWTESASMRLGPAGDEEIPCPENIAGIESVGRVAFFSTIRCGEGAVSGAGSAYAVVDGGPWQSMPFGDHANVAGAAVIGDRLVVITDTNTGFAFEYGVNIWVGDLP